MNDNEVIYHYYNDNIRTAKETLCKAKKLTDNFDLLDSNCKVLDEAASICQKQYINYEYKCCEKCKEIYSLIKSNYIFK